MIHWMHGVVVACGFVAGEDLILAKVPEGYELVEGSLRFATSADRVAYVVSRNGELHPVVGDEVGDGYDQVEPPVIHPAGESVYFRVMERNKKAEEEWTLLLNGKKVSRGGWVGPVALSAEGVPAYWVFDDRVKKGGC